MTRCNLAREPAAAGPLIRSPLQICAACGVGTRGKEQCPKCGEPEPNSRSMAHGSEQIGSFGPYTGRDLSSVPVRGRSADTPEVRTTVVSRDGEVETRTQAAPGAPAPAPAPGANRCNLVSAKFTSIPAGTLVPTLAGTRLQAPFAMQGEFTQNIPCTCSNGEYRQYVRGKFTHNGAPVAHTLGPGVLLDATTFQEDGTPSGFVYGHRGVTPTATNDFLPDNATGCKYVGSDTPSISAGSGATITMNLNFQGDLIDTLQGNKVLATSSWSVVGSAVIP